MIKKLLTFMLGFVMFTASNSALVSAQTTAADNAAVAKIKAAVLKRSTGKNRRVKVTMLGGTKLTGELSRIDDKSFTLIDSKTTQSIDIAYGNVAEIAGSGGGLSLGAKIGIGVAIAAGITAAILLGTRYCNEQAC